MRWIFGGGALGHDFDERGAVKVPGPPGWAHEGRNPGRLPEGRDGSGAFKRTLYTGRAPMSRFNPQRLRPRRSRPCALPLVAGGYRVTGRVPGHARVQIQADSKESPAERLRQALPPFLQEGADLGSSLGPGSAGVRRITPECGLKRRPRRSGGDKSLPAAGG